MAEWGVFLVTRRGETPPARAIRIGASMNSRSYQEQKTQHHRQHFGGPTARFSLPTMSLPTQRYIAFLSREYPPSTQRNYYENSNSKSLRSTDILERDVGRVGSGDGVHVSRRAEQ